MRKYLFKIVLFSLVGIFGGSQLHATPDDTPSPDKKVEAKYDTGRDSWLLGLGALGGVPINNDGTDEYWDMGAGMVFQVGRMLRPGLALMLDTHGMAVGESKIEGYDEENNPLVQGVVAIAVQYWTSERFWIKAGIGGGQVRASATVSPPGERSFDIIEMEKGFGTLAAVGYEFYHGLKWGGDVHLRFAGISGNNLSRAAIILGFGMAWYP